ncbi:hypothetical protein [Spiroplasma endosymbiont of Lonchoptera lutea]|uniref:hypothetical protein n=1 Tax=Spiroplasma endosymbiont of Lonchoptera lutea TaxID=3066297 RepID=UPI0030D04428
MGKYYKKIDTLLIKTKNNKKSIKGKINSEINIDIFEKIKENQKIINLEYKELETINKINSRINELGLNEFINKNNFEKMPNCKVKCN